LSSVGWLALVLVVAEPGSGRLEDWLARAPQFLSDAPGMEAARRSRESSKAAVDASYRQAPWVLETAVEYTHFLTEQVAGFVQDANGNPVALTQDFDLSGRTSLGLRMREGVSAELSVNAGLAGVGGTNLGDPENLPFGVGLNVAYDLLRGGARSIENERARGDALRAFSTQLSADARALELDVSLRRALAGAFINRCKARVVARIRGLVDRSLIEEKVQLAADDPDRLSELLRRRRFSGQPTSGTRSRVLGLAAADPRSVSGRCRGSGLDRNQRGGVSDRPRLHRAHRSRHPDRRYLG
jgi:hypothetical protein